VTSVVLSGTRAAPTVTITGSGFGSAPTGVPLSSVTNCPAGSTGTDFAGAKLWVSDAPPTSAGPLWTAGAQNGTTPVQGDCIGLNIVSYSSTQIVFNFGNQYNTHSWILHDGDGVTLSVKKEPFPFLVPSGF
jgi:hypothetical protein